MDAILVLNADLGPLHRVTIRHAIRMLLRAAFRPYRCHGAGRWSPVGRGARTRVSSRAMHGRIWFSGNPWPDGHRLSEFAWSGRLDARGRLWFDLHLRTLPYADEADPRPGTDVGSGWASASTWTAYDRATLSSTFWPDRATGVLAATQSIPFRFADSRPQIRSADPLPVDPEGKPAVNVDLLGPGEAAEHEIEFTRQPAGGFSIVWTGLLDPAHGGSPVFDHEFRAEVSDVEFGPVRIPDGMPAREALVLLEKLVDPADAGSRFRLA